MKKIITKISKKLRISVPMLCITTLFIVFMSLSICVLTQPFVWKISSEPVEVSAERLEKHVRYFSETVHPRNYEQMDNLNAAADYISEEFKQTGVEVTEQTFEVNGKKYRNIIAHFGPKEGAVTVIGAHYDSYADTPGADDNASGVAGLIELAHLLQKNPPKNSVELIAYTLEEPPFFKTENMGSVHHAHAFKTSGRPLRLMISIEMIGYFSDKSDSQNYPIGLLKTLYPNKGNFIGIIGRSAESKEARKIKALMSGATDLPVYSMNAPVSLVTGLDFSDHRNFWAEGFNALLITDTAFFRNKNYHELEDTADTLDYSRMAKVIQGIYAVIQNY